MADVADLIRAIAAGLWVGLALFVFLNLRSSVLGRVPFMTKLGVSPTGVTMEFAEQKLDEAVAGSSEHVAVGEVAKHAVIERLERNADLLQQARILWVDDHPENNGAVIELLRKFAVRIDTPRTNNAALSLLTANRYDVVITDVARDDEGSNTDTKGLELARQVHGRTGDRVLLFSARFNPLTFPGATDAERLELARDVQRTIFGQTNRFDEALHLIMDVLERRRL